jgi:hypothetical protein
MSDKALREALEKIVNYQARPGVPPFTQPAIELVRIARQALAATQHPDPVESTFQCKPYRDVYPCAFQMEGRREPCDKCPNSPVRLNARVTALEASAPPRPAPTEEMVERGAVALARAKHEARLPDGCDTSPWDEISESWRQEQIDGVRPWVEGVLTAALQEPEDA